MKVQRNLSLALMLTVLLFLPHAFGQGKKYYFYHPVPYGSDGLFNPLSVLANGGFDSFQIISDRLPTWRDVYWENSCTNVWRNITDPLPVINTYGWNSFLGQEVFPMSFDINSAQYAPNIALHTLGGGMVYRKISEWYDYHEFPAPFILGAATAMAYEFINEAVENGPGYKPNVDCISDMLIFQPLGIVLFSFDGISEFFSSELSFNDWSQPVTSSFGPFAVRNAGQNFVMKRPLNSQKTTSLFVHFGDFLLVGLSLKTNNQDSFSFGVGYTSTGRASLPPINGISHTTITIGQMAGIYYDRNNSLLASMVFSDTPNNIFRFNMYPGFLSSNSFVPGFFITIARGGSSVIGITAQLMPLGLAVHKPGEIENYYHKPD